MSLYKGVYIGSVPNFARILKNAKFRRCCVLKVKISGMDTYFGDSTFVFTTVILNYFSVFTLL